MIDSPFRKFLGSSSSFLLRPLKALGLTPNAITIIATLIGLVAAVLVSQGLFVTAMFTWWAGRLLDGLDGLLARELQQSSEIGAFLDINGDMLSYSSMILGFFWIRPDLGFTWAIILVLYVLCISGALSLGSMQPELPKKQNRRLALATGLAEGGETGIYYSLCLLLPAFMFEISLLWIAILVITIMARLTLASKVLAKGKN